MARLLVELASTGQIEDPASPSVYGLGEAATRVVFVHAGRERAFGLGRETPLAGSVYARVAGPTGPPEIHMVPTAAALAFDVGLDELRDRKLLSFDPERVDRVRIAARDADRGFETTLERTDGTWMIVSPAVLAADQRAVGRLLSDLSLLGAEEFVDAPGDAEERALESPSFVVVLESAGDAQRLDLAAVVDSAAHLRLARGREGRVYQVRSALVGHFPRSLTLLRDRAVLRFDPAHVQAVQVDSAPGSGSSESRRGVPDGNLVALLANLDAIEIVADALGTEERAALELDPARLRVRVFGAEDALLADLHLGRLDRGRGILARAGDGETIWLLDETLDGVLGPLLDALEDEAGAQDRP
jgi:hypothetical protein